MKTQRLVTTAGILVFAFIIVACSNATTSEVDTTKKQLQNLSGTYMDIEPYAYGEAFGQRIFTFDEGKWTLEFTLSLDPNQEMNVFEFRTYGTYTVLEPSSSVDGAYEALFLESEKFVTLLTDNQELINAFGFAPCGLTKGIEKNISSEGCSLWAPVIECDEDHDLLYLNEDGALHFGVRPEDNNMCTADKRPTSLTPAVIKVS